MTSILTITLNPTVDFATHAPKVFPGQKLRCDVPRLDPGGGGINVSRAIRLLGGQSTALVAIGGPTGAQLLQFLAFEGVSTVAIQGPGDTRRSFSITDDTSGEQYRFVTPGPDWHEDDVERAIAAVDRATTDNGLIVLSGSQPPGVAKDFPSILAAHVAGKKARLIVDTSGPALRQLTQEPREAIYALRMNLEEAEELVGHSLNAPEDVAGFARKLVRDGVAEIIVVARGAAGSVLANGDDAAWISTGAKVDVKSPIGAGDSFVAGLSFALAQGQSADECLRFGTAAAGATVACDATQLCDADDVQRLLAQCTIEAI